MEEGILFEVAGSGLRDDLYGYFYRDDIVRYEDLNDTIKSYLVLHSFDYKNALRDDDKGFYKVELERLRVTYGKIFGSDEDFKFHYLEDYNPRMEVNNNIVCIYDDTNNDYKRKDLVYSLNRDKVDSSFLNNADIKSNVLLKYQDQFPIYKYTYEKDTEHYHFKSVEVY